VDLGVEVATEAQGKCTKLFVRTVKKNVKCRLSPARTGRYIARNASPSTGSPGSKINLLVLITFNLNFFIY